MLIETFKTIVTHLSWVGILGQRPDPDTWHLLKGRQGNLSSTHRHGAGDVVVGCSDGFSLNSSDVAAAVSLH